MLRLDPAAIEQQLSRQDLQPEDRAFLTRELAAYERLVTNNPLQRYFPHPKQELFHESRDKIKAFLGGNRSGKTTAGVIDDLIQAVDEEFLPDHLKQYKKWQPPFFCRILTPDFVSTMEGVMFEALRLWAPRGALRGGSWEKAYNKQLRRLEFANGSFFEFFTYEQDVDKMGGAARHRIHHDEEPPEGHRKECLLRLGDYGGDELFTMTPLHGMTWMYDGVYERRYQDGVTVVEVDAEENPHLDRERMEEIWAELSEEERKARKEGKFVVFGGLVLAAFDDEHNLADPLEVEEDNGRRRTPAIAGQQIIVGIDPGVARGGVVWAAFDRDNHMLVFDELYPKNLTTRDIARQIKFKNAAWGIRPDLYVIDPSARNRSLTNAVNVQTEFMQEGIPTVPGQNDRLTGVLQLRRRLTARPTKLTVTRNCVNWLYEKGRWRVHEDEETSQEKSDGDSFKTRGPDHVMDPTRYVALARIWGPAFEDEKRKRSSYNPNHEDSWEPVSSQTSGPMGVFA